MPEHVESTPEAESDVVTVLGSTGSFPIDAPSTSVSPRRGPRTRASTICVSFTSQQVSECLILTVP